MERSKKLNDLWPYLPAFRAVAEEEHLPRAAARLKVVPSAVSRSVRRLEEILGEPVFLRRGRRIGLNARGRALLAAVQGAMGALERAVGPGPAEELAGEVRVGTIGVLTNHVVLPALLELCARHPGLLPAMRNARAKEAAHALLAGSLEVAFCYDAVPVEGTSCVRLGALGAGVYCGRGHPLFDRRGVGEAEILRHAFSAPSLGDRNVPMDGWPVHKPRRVGFQIELLLTNLEVARTGRFLTVLPDIVAAGDLRAGRLRRFAAVRLEEIEVFGLWREGEGELPLVRELRALVQRRLGSGGGPRTQVTVRPVSARALSLAADAAPRRGR